MSPQQVVAGKPNLGVDSPGGGGAGVVCSFASLAAREGVFGELEEELRRLDRSRKSVTRKDFEDESENLPWPKD